MKKMGWFRVVRGHSRSWAMPPFDRAHTCSYSALIETVSILYRFRDIAGYLSKVVDFDPPYLHSATGRICGDLWRQTTRVPGLSCGVVCVIPCLAVLVELRLVTDRRTDTDGRRPCMASTADA